MKRIGLCLLLWLCMLQAQAAITASLDRTQMSLGETVALTITASDGDDIGQPDLSALNADFRVLGQSSSSRFSFTNGHSSSSKTLVITLMPKHLGKLSIPPLSTAAGSTQALQLEVSNHSAANTSNNQSSNNAANNAATNRDLFVQTSVSPTAVYVGQQATVSIKLYYSINLNGGSLDSLNIKGASVQPLGKAKKYSANLNGRSYQVYEQDYAVFPSDSGTLTIPSVAFQGHALSATTSNFFGMQVPGFGMPSPVTAASDPITLKVKPIPADWKGLWLPAHKLSLGISGLPADDTLTVGVPLNLHLSISAQGLPASSLPDLSLPDMDNASVYADKANSKSSMAGDLIKGEKNRSFAILPQHPGKLIVPATRLSWFNTTSGKTETIELPAHTFTVVAASGQSATTSTAPSTQAPITTAPATAPTTTAPAAAAANPSGTQAPAVMGNNPRKLAFFASLGLCLLLVLWLLWRARSPIKTQSLNPKPAATSTRGLRQRALQQLQQQDKQALASLLAWANSERAGISKPGMLKLALQPTQAELIPQLEAWCYAGQAFPTAAANAFAKGFDWSHQQGRAQAEQDPLAPLYPSARKGRDNT